MRPETLGALREKPEARVIRERLLEAARGGAAPACPCIPFANQACNRQTVLCAAYGGRMARLAAQHRGADSIIIMRV